MRALGKSACSAGVCWRIQRAPLIKISSSPAMGASWRRSASCSITSNWLGTATRHGVAPARKTLEAFVRHHHSQGLSDRLVAVDELFHPSTYESYSI